MTEWSGPQGPAGPGQHVRGDRLGQRPDPGGAPGAVAALVVRVGVDLGRRRGKRGPDGVQSEVDRAQVGQRVRAEVALGRRREQRLPDRAGSAVPAGGDPGAAVAEPGPADIAVRRPDRLARHCGKADVKRVAARHAGGGPAAGMRLK